MPNESDIERLVLIEDELPPMKMIVTWAKVYFDYGELLADIERPSLITGDTEFAAAWARLAGIDIDDVDRWCPVLFENGLLLDGGVVSDTALGYVKARGLAVVQAVGV